MARHLLSLSKREFDKYKASDCHIIPRASWGRLTTEEQNKARDVGIVARSDDYQTHAGAPVEDLPIADSRISGPDTIEDDPEPEKQDMPILEISADERTWYVVRQVLDMIISAPNPRLEAECLRLSSGLGMLDNITEASIARKHGLTRAAISKRCVRQTKLLGIRPSQFMRSIHLRKTYSKARIKSLKKKSDG